MRELKFRIYDKAEGAMVFSGCTPSMLEAFFGSTATVETAQNQQYQQFTGLRDKNGKEIYEGDIVRADWNDRRYPPVIGVVEWEGEDASFTFGAGCASEVSITHEVIGNIYENPELLEEP